MCSSSLTRACRKPWDAASPSIEAARSSSLPRTLTYTRAWRRSGLVSTEVTVTNPILGSFRPSAKRAESTSRTASLTLLMRPPATLLIHHVAEGNGCLPERRPVGVAVSHPALQRIPDPGDHSGLP